MEAQRNRPGCSGNVGMPAFVPWRGYKASPRAMRGVHGAQEAFHVPASHPVRAGPVGRENRSGGAVVVRGGGPH